MPGRKESFIISLVLCCFVERGRSSYVEREKRGRKGKRRRGNERRRKEGGCMDGGGGKEKRK